MERDRDRRPVLVGNLVNSCMSSANWICCKRKTKTLKAYKDSMKCPIFKGHTVSSLKAVIT